MQVRWILNYRDGWVIVTVGCTYASLPHNTCPDSVPYASYAAETTAWGFPPTRAGGKTQTVLPGKHSANSGHEELPATLSCGAQDLQGCDSDDTRGAQPASPASSSPSQYSEISSRLSHPACHYNAANLAAAVAAQRPAKEGTDLS